MKKKFLLDTNILMRSPRSIYVFDDNDVLICDTTLEELDDLKTRPGDTGYNAREVIRILNKLREGDNNLYEGIVLPGGGKLTVVRDCTPEEAKKKHGTVPDEWSSKKPDNRIISTALKNGAILVTNDISMLLKAETIGVETENFKNESVSDESLKYTGRTSVYALTDAVDKLYSEGQITLEDLYFDENIQIPELQINEFLIVSDVSNPSHTGIGYFDGKVIKKIKGNQTPFEVKAKNVGQKFAIEALMKPADEVPLVFLQGPAGTAKTFLSLACGLEQTMEEPNRYKKMLLLRPNIKFDDDIGFLKGDEMDKIMPLIRPCLDNLEALVSSKDDSIEEINDKVTELFDRGYVTAEALAYLRGRSISNTYIVIDEAQNTTPNQMLGIITRAGIGSKIVIVGDPQQIDNPKVDKHNNGLVYAAEKMRNNPLCMQLTFDDEECVRSPLALVASQLLSKQE